MRAPALHRGTRFAEKSRWRKPAGFRLLCQLEALGLEHTLLVHSLSDLLEAGDVRACDQIVTQTIFLSSLCGDLVDVLIIL